MNALVTVVVVATAAQTPSDKFRLSLAQEGFDLRTVTTAPGESFADKVNAEIAGCSTPYVAVVEAEGFMAAGLGGQLTAHFGAHPETDILYFDEAHPAQRDRIESIARPDFGPERLRNQFYWGELVLYRRALFTEIGGLSAAAPGAELYELALRASRQAVTVSHLAVPGFVCATLAMPLDKTARESTRVILQSHLDATGGGTVRAIGADGVHDTRRVVTGEPLISIVIPSRGVYSEVDGVTVCYLLDAVESIIALSTYTNVEFVTVLDTVADPLVVGRLQELCGKRLTVVDFARPFNFSEKINEGVLHSRGEFVLLLNDDIKVISPDWLESLLALAQLPGAGMSGALLYFADETIQHAGHGYFKDDASHIGLDAHKNDPGPLNGYRVEREVAGVTAACALMPRSVFFEVGGLSSLLPGNFNDVDLCMKVTWLGYKIYWTPHATLYHYESKTRDASVHGFEVDITWGRWGHRMHDTVYWPYAHNRPPGTPRG